LSTWFRDYVYIPLGGSKVSKPLVIRNIFIIFVVSGFWHGANWTFLAWGFLNALYFLPLLLIKQNRKNLNNVAEGRYLPTFREFIQISVTFLLTTFAWVFFRADSMHHAFAYLDGIFSTSLFAYPEVRPKFLLVLIFLFVVGEWLQRTKQHALEFNTTKIPRVARWAVYYMVFFAIFYYGGQKQEFIYFQF
jgi:D-alanyl-lipoteichoic acid acyltransferase DltB (MBOAT superfamily)